MRKELLVVFLLVAAGMAWIVEGWREKQPPRMSVQGIALGMTQTDVENRLGPPREQGKRDATYVVYINAKVDVRYSKDQNVESVRCDQVWRNESSGSVSLSSGKSLDSVFKISSSMSRARVEKLLGVPVHEDGLNMQYVLLQPVGIQVTYSTRGNFVEYISGYQLEIDGRVAIFPFQPISEVRSAFPNMVVAPNDSSRLILGDRVLVAFLEDRTNLVELMDPKILHTVSSCK